MDILWRMVSVLLSLTYLPAATSSPLHLRVQRDAEELYPQNVAEENLDYPGGFFIEGDILLQRRRNAVTKFHLTWVNRTVPFIMDSLDSDNRDKVLRAMEEIMNKSCVRFVPRTKETDYIKIVKTGGCFSPVGRAGRQQLLYLAPNCYYHGVIVHELMHALGFWHEHSRPDRDNYITIIWNNIAVDHRSNFEKYGTDMIDVLGAPYDYGSIMHYRNNTFAIDRSHITIDHTQPLPPGVEMGQRIGLSEIDVLKLNRLYRCNITRCSSPATPRNGWKVENSTLVGAEVTYSCHLGYRLYGSRGRSCLDQGFWTGHVPSCLPNPDSVLHVCDFDNQHANPFCGWVNLNDSDAVTIPWIPRNRATVSNDTGPEEDHTMGSEEGWYIYLEASDRLQGQRAQLLSEKFSSDQPEAPLCMMFYYSMHGKDMGTLNVYQRNQTGAGTPPYTDHLLFSMSGEQGREWKLGAITLLLEDDFRVVVEAVVGSGFQSDIAVDDLLIGPCSSLQELDSSAGADTFHCSFDTGWCNVEQDKLTDDFNWRRLAGETLTVNTGPECDPLDCNSGSYIYIESSRPRLLKDKARLLTPVLHGEGSRCLEFFWHMYGAGMGNLSVNVRQLDGSEVTVWSQSGSHGNQWHFEHVDIPVTPRFYKLVFEGLVGESYTSDAAVDNIDVYVGGCHGVVHNDCTFEQNLCSWENVGQREWRRNQGNTPTPGTGPTLDHNNSSSGYYLYVESSRTFPNETARLRSGQMSGNLTGYCLQFWYHMLGAHVGVLSVLTTPATPDGGGGGGVAAAEDQERMFWQQSGDHEDVWHHHLLYIVSPGQQDFNIIFEARLAGGSEGDIAIDDIVVHAGPCEMPVELSLH